MESIFLFCNPISIVVILTILVNLFYSNKNDNIIKIAPFLILGIGIILSICPIIVVVSGNLGLVALGIMLLMMLSVIISVIYFFYSLRKTAKILGNQEEKEVDVNTKKINSYNFIMAYIYFTINVIVIGRVLYLIINKGFGGIDGFIETILSLPGIIFLVSILVILLGDFFKKLYNIPILYFITSIISSIIMFVVGDKDLSYFVYICRDLIFVVVSTVLLVGYLKIFKKQINKN